MPTWICERCGLEHPDTPEPPERCVLNRGPVSVEQRGDIGPAAVGWTTLAGLAAAPHTTAHRDHGRGVHSFRREPAFAIGQWSFVAVTPRGTLLWDPPAYLDDEVAGWITGLGAVAAIATSHPHMFAAQISWSHHLGGVPVFVNAADQEWLPRTDPVVELWQGEVTPLPGVELVQVGGHMPGSSVAHVAHTILAGDTITGALVPDWVSFQRSFPQHIPLSAAVVRRIADRVDPYDFDRLYTLGGDTVDADAKQVVRRSAEAHIRWVSGEFDHLT